LQPLLQNKKLEQGEKQQKLRLKIGYRRQALPHQEALLRQQEIPLKECICLHAHLSHGGLEELFRFLFRQSHPPA
jgi:hypothetical protein